MTDGRTFRPDALGSRRARALSASAVGIRPAGHLHRARRAEPSGATESPLRGSDQARAAGMPAARESMAFAPRSGVASPIVDAELRLIRGGRRSSGTRGVWSPASAGVAPGEAGRQS